MKSLNRKLIRDIRSLRGQVAAIAVVVAAGVMTLIISLTTLDALTGTMDRFYRDYQFGQVFADLKRAPEPVAERLREISGVNQVETRVRAAVRLEVPECPDPVRGQLLSLPEGRQPEVNRLYLREGRLPMPERAEEVAVSEAFAEAHGLAPGDTLRAIIRGGLEELRISGIVLSPEFVYQIAPADLVPDYERYAILWMNRRALAQAYAMDGAFNSVAVTLQADASEDFVIASLDRILAPYGGVGAHGRDQVMSHRFLTDELEQIRAMATVLPAVFLGVAGFLLHVLMGRIVRTQREQIAVLKAFGYRNTEIALHYCALTGLVVLVGAVAGIALGAWAADALAGLYREYFRFPEIAFRLRPGVILVALGVSGGAALLGAIGAVRSAVGLPPAEAMRPPAPERFRRGWLDRSALGRWLGQPTRIIFRNLARHPLKASLSVLGVGLAGALLLVGGYQFGAVEHMIDVQYRLVQRMDTHLTFDDPTPERAIAELRHAPGVYYAEGYRSVPVRLSAGSRDYQTSILGMDTESRLRGLIDGDYRPVGLPPDGILMTRYLADFLGVEPGERISVELLEGARRTVEVPLAGTVDEPLGVSAYMERRALNRLLREGPAVNGAWLLVEESRQADLFSRLWEMSRIAGIGMMVEAERGIREHLTDTILVFMSILLLLAGSIAFAVVYNNARIALAERTRELATLRVLGFTRGEIGWILIGEIGILTLAALPVGWLTGTLFAFLLSEAMSVDMYRIPFVITPWTYAFSAAGVLLASVLSVLLIARRIRDIDMVSALKAAE